VLVPAASIRPPKALPSENATLRTTLLKLIALEVSLSGVTARMTPGWRMGSRREHGESDEDNNGAAAQEDERDDPFA
jgi:hypothetical protein